jgi:predicted O-methyltransferase YrrM
MSNFNLYLAQKMFGVDSEDELREKLHGQWTDLTEVEFLSICNHLDKFKNPKYLEIGVWWGGNFIKVANYLSNNFSDYHLTGVDLFESLISQQAQDQTHDIFNKWNILNVSFKGDLEQAIKNTGIENFTLKMGMSHETVEKLEEKYDVLFIDGNHTFDQTLKDAEACIRASKIGSFLIFHNASDDIQPDPQYVERDGGPWSVCEKLKERKSLRYVGLFDRCSIFEVVE